MVIDGGNCDVTSVCIHLVDKYFGYLEGHGAELQWIQAKKQLCCPDDHGFLQQQGVMSRVMSSSCLMMLDHVGLISAFSIGALQHLPSAPSALQWFL